ncbi:MAG: type VI secretion system protein TssL, partial [Oceanospirillaceae bacterium]|nr:type VI secretion system protein TssL [Oceanospirillaceae bacterium]
GDGSVEVETDGKKIIIRIKEKGAFDSGSAELKFESIPVLAKIRDVLLDVKGNVAIEGHSDNIPYAGRRFESNWDLSVARALAVAHELFGDPRIDQSRFKVLGLADTKPLAPNDTRANRVKNRRVEIIVQKGKDKESPDKIKVSSEDDPDAELLNLSPTEIF